jgi:hypothetical protein
MGLVLTMLVAEGGIDGTEINDTGWLIIFLGIAVAAFLGFRATSRGERQRREAAEREAAEGDGAEVGDGAEPEDKASS